jgi:uncharacterized protein
MTDKPVTVAVLADTHLSRLDELPPKVLDTLAKVDVIIHLGDFTSRELLNDLRKLGNFYGIWGNHDRLPVLRKELNKMEVIELGGKRLGLIHGFFYPVSSQRRMKYWFREHDIDILLYGHTHSVTKKTIDGVLLFNPGAVTCKFPATMGSFGLLTLDGTITTEIIPTGELLPMKKRLLFLIPAFVIKNGTRFLESWPYVNTGPLVNLSRRIWSTISSTGKKLIFRHKYDKVMSTSSPGSVINPSSLPLQPK